MILFPDGDIKLYNYIIHKLLETELYSDDSFDIGDQIENFMPKYLFREQYAKCVKTFDELYDWTTDNFYHTLSVFHELALNNFLEFMASYRQNCPDFDKIYFDKKAHEMIKEAAKADFDMQPEDEQDFTLEECEQFYYDLRCYADSIFLDTDIDLYYDILPMDIQKKHQSKHITLVGEIDELLSFIDHRIHEGNLFELFWENGVSVNEERIHVVLENIMHAYFYHHPVDISRESMVGGTGKVDFKLYKADEPEEKILIEVKLAKSSRLDSGYKKQLTEYLQSSRYINAFYLIACFTDEDFDKAARFSKKYAPHGHIQPYTNISILDLRMRKPPSVK